MARDDGARRRRRRQEIDDYPTLEPEGQVRDEAPALEEVGRSRRGLPPFVLVGLAVTLVFAAGFAGRTAQVLSSMFAGPTAAPTAVPWLEVQADVPAASASPVEGTPGNVAPCSKTIGASQRWIDTDIWPEAVIVLTNNSKTKCYVLSTPSTTASLLYEDGTYLQGSYAGDSTLIELHPNEKSAFRLIFADICRTFASPSELSFTAGVASMSLTMSPPPGYDARCGSYPPGSPGDFAVTGYEKWPSPRQPDLPEVRIDLVSFQNWVTPGERIFYTIDITNMSSDEISLYPCPTYRQYVIGLMVSPPVEYRLNCEALGGRLGPGQKVRMEMGFDVPPQAATGAATFVWETTSGLAGRMSTPVAINPPN